MIFTSHSLGLQGCIGTSSSCSGAAGIADKYQEWVHIAQSFDGADKAGLGGSYEMYVNGQLWGTTPAGWMRNSTLGLYLCHWP